jgi:hypothetical protein
MVLLGDKSGGDGNTSRQERCNLRGAVLFMHMMRWGIFPVKKNPLARSFARSAREESGCGPVCMYL